MHERSKWWSMISSEVQRTLVKSPPELWAEISDPEALARHLGEFGEIRITRVQPEQKVEWEAAEASGSIVIKPSGWGTKVKLTVSRELGEPEAGGEAEQPQAGELPAIDDAADETAAEEAPVAEAGESHGTLGDLGVDESVAEQPIPILATGDEAHETESSDASDGLPDELAGSLGEAPEESDLQQERDPEPQRRRGFFARLFGRKRTSHAGEGDDIEEQNVSITSLDGSEPAREVELEDDDCDEPEVAATEIAAETEYSAALAPDRVAAIEVEADLGLDVEPATGAASDTTDTPQADGTSEHPAPAGDAASLAAELEQAEEDAVEQVEAVLTGVLDRLGAAHHRPFSRA